MQQLESEAVNPPHPGQAGRSWKPPENLGSLLYTAAATQGRGSSVAGPGMPSAAGAGLAPQLGPGRLREHLIDIFWRDGGSCCAWWPGEGILEEDLVQAGYPAQG